MAILLVKIEDERSLPLNEFFDYNGYCYASTRSRAKTKGQAIDMANFYEAAINTERLHDIPVVFVSVDQEMARVLGWYRRAEIFNKIHTPSLFLEGNIRSRAGDAVWQTKEDQTHTLKWNFPKHIYEIIEEEDATFLPLMRMIEEFSGKNQMIRYHSAKVNTVPKLMQTTSSCREACVQWANLIMEEKCQDIRDIKTLEAYAKKLCEKDRKDSDGYYYLALASYHLGFVKEGLKQIKKALQLEPDASDLIALRGLLLISRGYVEEGAVSLHEAFEKSQYEFYLVLEGRAYLIAGKIEKARACFAQVQDKDFLTNSSDFYHNMVTESQ